MVKRSSRRVLDVAIAANTAIALSKYGAAAISGSPAMLAEAFHSTADSCNEFLLIFGLKRSQKPPDELHPFGHGKELYFWSLVVAIVIFGLGGGFSLRDGIAHLWSPAPTTKSNWNYCVLGIAAVFEGYSWVVSRQELLGPRKRSESLWRVIRTSKDPTVFTVFLEDSAALVGIAIAFLGIALGKILHNPYYDPAASVLIGLILIGVAVLLGNESRELLLGERASLRQIQRVKELIRSEPAVEAVGDLFTMQLGPEQVLLAVALRFRASLRVQELEVTIDRLEQRIRHAEPAIKRIFIEAESLKRNAEVTKRNQKTNG
ncbi:MAG: cation diffusion facilitator family transporter [Candidatus Sulfotelmatobacter sp.]